MLKRIIYYMRKELVSGYRNNIVLYMILFTILLSGAMRLFLPSMEGMMLAFAAEQSLGEDVLDGLARYGHVEVFETAEEVTRRVNRSDDVPGMIYENGEYIIVLEGNESGEAEGVAQAILGVVLSGGPVSQYRFIPVGEVSAVRQMMGALILLMAALMGGLMVGLNIVGEKETRSVKALAVTPLKTNEMVLGHIGLSVLIGLVIALLSAVILLGLDFDYGRLILTTTAASLIGIIIGYLIGAVADNLISSIAVIKVLMLIFLGVPIGSVVAPEQYQWLFYPFPHYWAFWSNMQIVGYKGFPFSYGVTVLLAFLLGMIILSVVTLFFKRRLNLR